MNTCSEKWVVANKVSQELANLHPRPPAVRLFDAGLGDGTVLTRVMRAMHHRYPTMPFYISGKEISLEDIRLTLEKMPDRFFEHPATVLVLTNMYYSEAPWLTVKSPAAANSLVWNEVALTGNTSHDFEEQITNLQGFLAENWKAGVSAKTGNPIYERPVVLVLYRQDHKFLLDPIIPRRGQTRADFDLVIASQPYRARASAEFKAAQGDRAAGARARHRRPADRDPFGTAAIPARRSCRRCGRAIIRSPPTATRSCARSSACSGRRRAISTSTPMPITARCSATRCTRLPSELTGSIGTSTVLAAWNAAIYVSQVEDERLNEVVKDGRYLDSTREVLRKHNGLWFNDEVLRHLAPARVKGDNRQHDNARIESGAASLSTDATPRITDFLHGFSLEATHPKASDIAELREAAPPKHAMSI